MGTWGSTLLSSLYEYVPPLRLYFSDQFGLEKGDIFSWKKSAKTMN